jgi:hypothetical protein
MHINVTTPALLFPAISLLMLAFTNRFLALAALIRELYRRRLSEAAALEAGSLEQIDRQMANLKIRIELIRSMQALGMISFILCTISMFAVFLEQILIGDLFFGASLAILVLSLIQSFREIQMSVGALEVLLGDLKK